MAKMMSALILSIVFIFSFVTSVFGLDWQLVDDGDPAPRGSYGMTYDSSKEKVILFGGDPLTGYSTDTWEYDGVNWKKKVSLFQPPTGNIRGMVYDADRDRVVLLLRTQHPPWGPPLETWEYDGLTWR